MRLEEIFTPEELASIDAGTYDITKGALAAKIDFCAALEREACAKVCEKAMIQMNYSEAPYKQCAAAIRARGLK